MISRVTGRLTRITDQHALVENGGIYYEILVPSALAQKLKEKAKHGEEIAFDTIYYIEAGDRKSNHYPRLVGFTSPIDREFFSLFTQVPGLGVKKALKSLVMPIREIAAAIETRDTATLTRLPGVGGRLAEKIVAELNGKTAKFTLDQSDQPLATTSSARTAMPFEAEATEVLQQLQYRPQEIRQMIASALDGNPEIKSVEQLISVIFRSRQSAGKAEDSL